MLIAATPFKPPVDGNCWAFHFVNDSAQTVGSLLLDSVDYEWGDMSNGKAIGRRYGPIPAGSSVEIWRDDSDAAELRMSLYLEVDSKKVMAEFPKLYKVRTLSPIPILGLDGYAASLTSTA